MSNFTVNGVYTYSSSNVYSYLGIVPSNQRQLQEAFREYHITPTGTDWDLKRLKNAIYEDYSTQVKEQIENQNQNTPVIPWSGLLAQIGIQATGDYEKDYNAFNNAIKLLSQSAVDGQAMSYFASLRSEADIAFGLSNRPAEQSSNVPNFYDFMEDNVF